MALHSVLAMTAVVKTVLAHVVRPAWPAIEAASRADARLRLGHLRVRWSDVWTHDFDAALESLPLLEGCPHNVYRELVRPTTAQKRHAIVTEADDILAVISLRRRGGIWEPVAYQCLPCAIAPARDYPALGRALNALGLEIVIAGGVGDFVNELQPSMSWAYDWHKIDLQSDYEAHWRKKKRQYTISRARRSLAELDVRVDGEGDLEWLVEKWRQQWADDPGCEVVAYEDRLNFWRALAGSREGNAPRLHTLQLVAGSKRAAGLVFTTKGDTVMIQCGGREEALDDGYTAAAFTVALVNWAVANGFRTIDMAGGEYKRHWGPVGGQRHGVVFRPRVLKLFRRVVSD